MPYSPIGIHRLAAGRNHTADSMSVASPFSRGNGLLNRIFYEIRTIMSNRHKL